MDSILITTDVLNVAHLKKQLPLHPCCGALICFEGIVRNHHSGQKVLGITYECFESMAKKELFLSKILGSSRKGRLALLLILGRILTQGSRRHLTFWKEGQAIEEVLGLGSNKIRRRWRISGFV